MNEHIEELEQRIELNHDRLQDITQEIERDREELAKLEAQGKPKEVSCDIYELNTVYRFHYNNCNRPLSTATDHKDFIRFDWSNHRNDGGGSKDSFMYRAPNGNILTYHQEGFEVIRPKAVIMRG